MEELGLSFFAISKSINFKFSTISEQLDILINDFLLIFTKTIDYENQKINIQSLQTNTAELRDKVNKFVQKYKDIEPKVHRFNSYFKTLKDNELFYFLPEFKIDQKQTNLIFIELASLQENKIFSDETSKFNELFENVLELYNLYVFDENTKKTIGELDKNRRICRFCGKKMPNVKFQNVSHAISEALGNKKIISNEECDTCNTKYGQGIEQDFTNYLKFYSAFFGVKGKENKLIKNIPGKNFDLFNTDTIAINYYPKTDQEVGLSDDIFNKRFETHSKIKLQSIYKTLSKYIMNVVDRIEIPKFKETIDWINGAKVDVTLPLVGILTSYNFFKHHPKLVLYLRKIQDNNLPYAIGEFHFTCLTFVFIIPFCNQDTKDFTNKADFDYFWDYFKHYSSIKDWRFRNFSNNEERNLVINMNFIPKDK
jgi:hypothetical protein